MDSQTLSPRKEPTCLQVKAKSRRRSHKKRRTGCETCKRRRILCDELKPSCHNCKRSRLQCPFASSESFVRPAGEKPVHEVLKNGSEGNVPRRGRPMKDWNHKQGLKSSIDTHGLGFASDRFKSSQANEPAITLRQIQVHSTNKLSESDSELLLHFRMHSAFSVAEENPILDMWQNDIPEFALSIPASQNCVLKLLLAFSSFHLHSYHSSTEGSGDYGLIGQSYLAEGIMILSQQLGLFNCDTRLNQVIFISSMLVCYCTLAGGPKNGEYLVFADKGSAEWEPLLDGFKQIWALSGPDIFTGPLKHLRDVDRASKTQHLTLSNDSNTSTGRTSGDTISLKKHLTDADQTDKMKNVPVWIMLLKCLDVMDHAVGSKNFQISPDERSALDEARNDLRQCYQAQINHISLSQSSNLSDQTRLDSRFLQVLGWIFRLPSLMKSLLGSGRHMPSAKHPQALLLVAYFCPLLQTLDHHWWMRGWAKHVFDGVKQHLDHYLRDFTEDKDAVAREAKEFKEVLNQSWAAIEILDGK